MTSQTAGASQDPASVGPGTANPQPAPPGRPPAEPAAGGDAKDGLPTGTPGEGASQAVPDKEAWLHDSERARDNADFSRGLDEADSGLTGIGQQAGVVNVGVLINGGVRELTGDIIGGSTQAGQEGRFLGEVITGQVTGVILDGIRQTFVPPESYGQLLEKVRDCHVALLRAPQGWGRTTAGLRVLSEACGEVWKLSPDTDLRTLDVGGLKDKAGYLVELRAVDQLMRLKTPHLERLASACAERGIKLLATADDDVPLPHLDNEYNMQAGPRPRPRLVLDRHLQAAMPASPSPAESSTRLQGILAREDIQGLLTDVADESLSMRRLAELAAKLVMAAAGDLAPERVCSHFSEHSQQDFASWLAGQPDPGQRALLIALAVLNGMPYYTAARLAESLAVRLHAAEGDDGPGQQVFGITRTERLASARAEIFDGAEQTPYGHVRIERVRFRNESYPRRVLEWTWREHDAMRPLLVDWLKEAGVDPSRQVRIRAAAATGVLAVLDFEWVRRELLLPWADSTERAARESAVAALRIPSQDPALSAHTVRMIRDWSAGHSPPRRQLSAARALGASAGRFIRDEALAMLASLGTRDNPALPYAISDSVTELFVAPEAGAQSSVIGALAQWTEPHQPIAQRSTGILCYLRLGLDYLTEEPDSGVTWPALLWQATRDEEQLNLGALLWGRALRMPAYVPVTHDVLASWAGTAAGNPTVTAALARFVTHTATDNHTIERFRYSMIRISRNGGDAGKVADTLLRELTEKVTVREH